MVKDRIESLCKEYSIKFVETEENYTSKCSFYDGEAVGFHEVYMGKRIERGLFRTKDGKLVNADINAALNILKESKTENDKTITRLMNSGVTVPSRIRIIA